MTKPDWLPECLSLASCGGDWAQLLTEAYRIFTRDFKDSRPYVSGLPVVHDGRLAEDGKEEGFWHLVSQKDERSGDRLPDIPRCEHLPWTRPTIDHGNDVRVSVWENSHGKHPRVLFWIEEADYLVVIERRRHVYMLITAYLSDRGHTRRKLAGERDAYRKKQTPPR